MKPVTPSRARWRDVWASGASDLAEEETRLVLGALARVFDIAAAPCCVHEPGGEGYLCAAHPRSRLRCRACAVTHLGRRHPPCGSCGRAPDPDDGPEAMVTLRLSTPEGRVRFFSGPLTVYGLGCRHCRPGALA